MRKSKTATAPANTAAGVIAGAAARPDAQEALVASEAALAHRLARNEEFATCKPSRMLEMALEDLAVIEKTKGYFIRMNRWHEVHTTVAGQEKKTTCYVCLAGSVMANSLNAPQDQNIGYGFFGGTAYTDTIAGRLVALDAFRCGMVGQGLRYMGVKGPAGVPSEMHSRSPGYGDPGAFRKDMHAIVTELKKHDL